MPVEPGNAEQEIKDAYLSLVVKAKDERFEDGITNTLSSGIPQYIDQFGPQGVQVIARIWEEGGVNQEAFMETLLILGRLQSTDTFQDRFLLLQSALEHLLPSIRDAAAVSISSLGDARALKSLDQALSVESVPTLKQSFQQAIDDLKSSPI